MPSCWPEPRLIFFDDYKWSPVGNGRKGHPEEGPRHYGNKSFSQTHFLRNMNGFEERRMAVVGVAWTRANSCLHEWKRRRWRGWCLISFQKSRVVSKTRVYVPIKNKYPRPRFPDWLIPANLWKCPSLREWATVTAISLIGSESINLRGVNQALLPYVYGYINAFIGTDLVFPDDTTFLQQVIFVNNFIIFVLNIDARLATIG